MHGIQKAMALLFPCLLSSHGEEGERRDPAASGNRRMVLCKMRLSPGLPVSSSCTQERHPFFHVSTAKITESPTLFTIKRLQIRITFITLASLLGCSLLPDRGAITPRKREC